MRRDCYTFVLGFAAVLAKDLCHKFHQNVLCKTEMVYYLEKETVQLLFSFFGCSMGCSTFLTVRDRLERS